VPSRNHELLTFESGLNEFVEASRLDPGFASNLRNWVPEPDGSLRCRVAWTAALPLLAPATRRVKGLGYMPKHQAAITVPPSYDPAIMVANRDAGGYGIYHVIKDDIDDVLASWTLLETVAPAGSPDYDRFMAMAMGLGYFYYCTPDFAEVRRWDGITANAPAGIANSKPGRALNVYRNRVFSGGDHTEPWKVYWTVAGDGTDWTGTGSGNMEVGKDDGEPVECITAFETGQLIGKSLSMHYLAGTTPANFQLITLDAGECAPGRAIVATPYGALIAGREEIWLYRGGSSPTPISQAVNQHWGLQGDFVTVAYIDGKAYICDQGRDDYLVYDFTTQAWHVEDYNDTGGKPGVLFATGDHMLGGATDTAVRPFVNYRILPDGSRGVDSAVGETFIAKTPELWLGGPSSRVTTRHAWLRYRQRGTGGAGMTVRHYVNGVVTSSKVIAPEAAAGVYRTRLDLAKAGVFNVAWEFEMDLDAGQACFDLEEVEVAYDLERET
jgi:hypothetical protein